MSEAIQVEFAGVVSSQLSTEFLAQLREDLADVFSQLCTSAPPPERILASRLFRGYTQKFAERIILGLEVQYADHRYETHIVKVGQRERIKRDYEGWVKCTRDRQVASRIFAPVQLVEPLGNDRVAVLYRDAYTLFGLDQDQSRPQTLEEVAGWAVQDDRPDPLSVERSIAHIYTDLARWFYPGARPDREATWAFYRQKLRFAGDGSSGVLQQWREDAVRRGLRRDAVWLICGRDKPDADPLTEPARYLDPVDFVDWMLTASEETRLPETLVGRSHGDLHGRNILLGVRRGETEYPAVFDYEDMSDANVLVWDFAKLEMELKIRLLPYLYDQDAAVRAVLEAGSDLPAVEAARTSGRFATFAGERGRRIAAFLTFEELLHDRTARIHSRVQAETIQAFPEELSTGAGKIDRLLGILLRIRREAALWLGYERRGRIHRWMDEYYFSIAVYGVLNTLWDYEPLQIECGLVAAGVSAARMPATPTTLARRTVDARRAVEQVFEPGPQEDFQDTSYMSYRVPLAVAHHFWKFKRYQEARKFLEHLMRVPANQDEEGLACVEVEACGPQPPTVAVAYQHAVPLIAEYALLETECNNMAGAEPLLESLRPQAAEFGDYETLGRIGRLFKSSGDRHWDKSETAFRDLEGTPAWQMYQKAMRVYEEAFGATGDYYTGINAATLAALTGDIKKARNYASQVADICARLPDVARGDRFWIFATEGEAAVLCGRWSAAVNFYTSAVAELTPGQGGMADSAYKQLRRLARVFEEDQVELRPILDLFENSQFRPFLSLDMFSAQEQNKEPPTGAAQ
jgi:hypothetical protein